MFFSTVGGLITCLFWTALSLIAAYTAKPKEFTTPFEKTLFLLFQLVIASSVWGLAEPRIGSAITTFRVSLLLFTVLYLFWIFRNHINPFHGFSACRWALLAIMAFMAGYGAVTLLFLTSDRSYTFSRLANLGFDILFCMVILVYLRSRQLWTSVVRNLAMILAGQMAVGFYECFAGPMYTDTHLKNYGVDFFGFIVFRLPSGTFYNTNDYCATVFFLAMPVLLQLLHDLFNGKRKGLTLTAITLIFCMEWFLCTCGGAILVQIGVLLFFAVFAVALVVWMKQQRHFGAFVALVIPILFAVIIYFAPSIRLSDYTTLQSPVGSLVDPTNRDDFSGLGVGSDEVMKNTTYRRVTLLKFALGTFYSNPFGVGLGNTQLLVGPNLSRYIGDIQKLHCYIAECLADFGIIFLLLGLTLIFFLFKALFSAMAKMRREGHPSLSIYPLLILVSLATAVFLSTAPSCAQDLHAMWIYLALLVIAGDNLKNMFSEVFHHYHLQ